MLQNPYAGIEQFCSSFSLPEARLQLWEFFKSFLEDTDSINTREERSTAIFFYENMKTLLEALYLLCECPEKE